ncbi:MAG TPA: hypothetical protein VFY32_11205, partial [Solirubrobacteraceae bacterium]|nr:hypothetical protein [Solirubrobacteraceae bacterium]
MPGTAYQGARSPGAENGRWAASSRPGWRGGSTSGRYVDPQRLGKADADLGFVAAAQAPAGAERRILEAGVIAGEGDELDRLAEREGVGALH